MNWVLLGGVLWSGLVIAAYRRELSYSAKLHKWEKMRFVLVQDLFNAAQTLVQRGIGMDHAHEFKEAPGGNIFYGHTMLNFQTLKDMVLQMQGTETQLPNVYAQLAPSVKALHEWQKNNPQPDPPTYFGKRIAFI